MASEWRNVRGCIWEPGCVNISVQMLRPQDRLKVGIGIWGREAPISSPFFLETRARIF